MGYTCISTLIRWHPYTTMREVFCTIFVMINYLPNGDSPYELERAHELHNYRELYYKKAEYFNRKYAKIGMEYKEYKDWDFTYNPLEKK